MNVIGHGVPGSLIDSVFAVAREFFEQSVDVKLQSTDESTTSIGYSIKNENSLQAYSRKGGSGHLKEIFDIGPPTDSSSSPFYQNVYPATPKHFRGVLDTYYLEVESVERTLFRVLSLALGQAAGVKLRADFLEKAKGRHRGLLRINYFPKCDFVPELGTMRDDAHTDWTPITILLAEKEGLEVVQDGEWRPVPLAPGAFIVNIGDQLHWWSNGRFKSSMHRVNAESCLDNSRISLAFFGTESVDPTDETVVTPVCAPDEAPRFEAVSIKDYLEARFASKGLALSRTSKQE